MDFFKIAKVFGFLVIGIIAFSWASAQLTPDLSITQNVSDILIPLDSQHAIGQTLLNGTCQSQQLRIPVEIQTSMNHSVDSWISIEIYSDIIELTPVLSKRVFDIRTISKNSEIQIEMPSNQLNTKGNCYILFQSSVDPGKINLIASRKDSFPSGSLYLDGSEVNGDLVFYGYSRLNLRSLQERCKRIIHQFNGVLFLAIVYTTFGCLILLLIGEGKKTSLTENLFTAMVIGFSSICTCLFIFSLLKIRFNTWTIFGLFLSLIFANILKSTANNNRITIKKSKINFDLKSISNSFQKQLRDPEFLIILVFTVTFLGRMLQTAELAFPSWVDAFFHASIINTINSSGMVSFDQDYQTGFHILVYINSLMSGWDIPDSILLTGQLLSALICPGCYYFVRKVFKNPEVAFVSSVLLSFYSPFPQYLINWSRFPILLGIEISLFIMPKMHAWINDRTSNHGTILIALMMLSLSHYASFIFLSIVFISWLIIKQLFNDRFNRDRFTNLKEEFLIPKGFLYFFLLPLIYLIFRVVNMINKGAMQEIMLENNQILESLNWMYYWNLLAQHGGLLVFIVGILGGFFLLLRQTRTFLVIYSWLILALIIFIGQQQLIRYSFPSFIDIFIWSFIPLNIAAGFGVTKLWKKMISGFGWWTNHFLKFFYSMIFIFIGFYGSIGLLNPKTILATNADKIAIAWISNNISTHEKILINTFRWGESYQPSDAGGWIPILTDSEVEYANEYYSVNGFLKKNSVRYIYEGNGISSFNCILMKGCINQTSVIYKDEGIEILRINNQ